MRSIWHSQGRRAFRSPAASSGPSSPEHGPNRRGVETSQFQRQRDEFVVAGRDIGEHKILDVMEGIEVAALRQKSLALTDLFMARVDALLPELEIMTPREPSLRGSQVGISFDEGYAVIQAMIERGVIGDFRAPDLMRFGFAPLYVRFQDVWDAAEILADCVNAEVWREPRFSRKLDVT